MLHKLIFEVEGKFWFYKVKEYVIKDNFYIFTDLKDGKERKFHTSLFRGCEPL